MAMLLASSVLNAQQLAADFVGTWELVSVEKKSASGDWVPDVSVPGQPVGIIMYDDGGNMAVQITSDPRVTDTPADSTEVVHGYVAYYARYEVDTQAGMITHHRRNHINPDLGQLSVMRYFDFSGDMLTLTVAPDKQLRLNWTRVR